MRSCVVPQLVPRADRLFPASPAMLEHGGQSVERRLDAVPVEYGRTAIDLAGARAVESKAQTRAFTPRPRVVVPGARSPSHLTNAARGCWRVPRDPAQENWWLSGSLWEARLRKPAYGLQRDLGRDPMPPFEL